MPAQVAKDSKDRCLQEKDPQMLIVLGRYSLGRTIWFCHKYGGEPTCITFEIQKRIKKGAYQQVAMNEEDAPGS